MAVRSPFDMDDILPKHDLSSFREMQKDSPIRADYPLTSTSVLHGHPLSPSPLSALR